MTQELLARIVGARRERVNQIVGELQNSGVVESGRGWLRLTDRAALIQRACECRQVLARAAELGLADGGPAHEKFSLRARSLYRTE